MLPQSADDKLDYSKIFSQFGAGVCLLTLDSHNTRFESDGMPFRCAPGQAAAQAERYTKEINDYDSLHI